MPPGGRRGAPCAGSLGPRSGRNERGGIGGIEKNGSDDVVLRGPLPWLRPHGVPVTGRHPVTGGDGIVEAADGEEWFPADVAADGQVHMGVGVDLDDTAMPSARSR